MQHLPRGACCLLVTLSLVAARAPAEETVETWAKQLSSAKPSEVRIAQAYLARTGANALPELARLAEPLDDRPQSKQAKLRLKETLALMLRHGVSPDAIRKHAKLWELPRAELERAAAAKKVLAGSKVYYRSGVDFAPQHQAMEQLCELGGFAIPAALELLKDPEPGSRMAGVDILEGQLAIGYVPAIQGLLKDQSPIEVFHGDYLDRTTIAKEVDGRLKLGGLHLGVDLKDRHAPAYTAELYIDWLDRFQTGEAGRDRSELISRLRSEGETFDAKSWDDYWRRARPVLEKAWDGK